MGGVTLEQTIPGRVLDYFTNATKRVIPYENLKPAWEYLSGQFANGASGPANAFIHYPEFNPSGILVRIELNTLGWNSAVPQINIWSVP